MKSMFVDFGDVARERLGMQCQYARHYLLDPALAADVRWAGDVDDYHFLTIHRDDVEGFVARVLAWRKASGIIA